MLLLKAIDSTSEHDLRTTLRRICIRSATAHEIAWDDLFLKKRKRGDTPELDVCEQCSKTYDMNMEYLDDDDYCCWHPGVCFLSPLVDKLSKTHNPCKRTRAG